MTAPLRRLLGRSRRVRRLREAWWGWRVRLLRRFAPSRLADGLPVPPPHLRFLISDIPDYPVADFLQMGRHCARLVQDALLRHGKDPRTLRALLDFGCGCGRVIRHFAHLEAAQRHGCDYNPVLVEWCRPHLPFARFTVNGLEPPLAHGAASLDLVYAFSVFTHLPEPLQHAWMGEMARVLAPGGHLALTTMPEHLLPADDVERFRAGRLVVVGGEQAGTNGCAVFHPYSYMRDVLAPAFDILEVVRGGAGQDFWLLRKKPV